MAVHVRVGVFSPSVVLSLAEGVGLLERAGLTVEEAPAASSSAQFDDLRSGRLDAVITSPDNVCAYRASPANPLGEVLDVRILAAVDRGLGLSLFAAPGVGSDEDLRGGILAVDVPSSGYAFVAYELLAQRGLVAGRDYEVRAAGPTPQRARSLVAGECAMTALNAGSDLRAEAAGCRRLGRATSLGPYVGSVLAAPGATVDREPVWLSALTTSVTQTCTEIAAGRLREPAAELAGARLGLDPAAASTYADVLASADEGVVPDGVLDTASLGTLRELRRRHEANGRALDAVVAPGSGLVDPRFLPQGAT
ncbi:MAG: ABC transporter substrate-binding protein [Actinomycetes bacterium]